METKIKIVVDAMGGDYAPEVPVQGAVEALQENTNISIVLVGRTDAIKEQLAKYTYDKERIEIVHAEEVIGFDEPPVMAVRKKKDSSIVVGMKLVKKGEAGCICISWKHRCYISWWSDDRWKDQRY